MNRSRRESFLGTGDMQRDMERWLNRVTGSARGVPVFRHCAWEPLADVYETDDEVVVMVEAAAADRDSLQLVLEGDILTISGVRRGRPCSEGQRYHQMEICPGVFERSIPLPTTVGADKASAHYDDGLIEIRLPKVGRSEPTRVPIRTIKTDRRE